MRLNPRAQEMYSQYILVNLLFSITSQTSNVMLSDCNESIHFDSSEIEVSNSHVTKFYTSTPFSLLVLSNIRFVLEIHSTAQIEHVLLFCYQHIYILKQFGASVENLSSKILVCFLRPNSQNPTKFSKNLRLNEVSQTKLF